MEKTYRNEQYSSRVLRGLDALRDDATLCDAALQTRDNDTFPVHRCVSRRITQICDVSVG